jgi:catechol 2,3-dioxygenase-like lactoylglutathione lyase family enzyme
MCIEIRGMSPLLSVFDMPASLAFYRDVLGFEIVQDSGQADDSGMGNAFGGRDNLDAEYRI